MDKKSHVSTNWTTISKKPLFQNKFVSLWHDEVMLPNGKESDYYVFRKNPFSVIIPIEDNNIYMTVQYRYPVEKISTEFPMGFAEGKNPRDTAILELREETGATAKKITEIGKFWIACGKSNQEGYVYVAKDLSFAKQELEHGEFIRIEKMSIEKVEKMIERGEILDGPTITSFHFLKSYLNKNMKSREN